MRTRLTERDLSRIVRRVMNEQQETNFCEEAEYNEQQALDHLNVLQDVKDMVKKYDEIIWKILYPDFSKPFKKNID